MKKTIFCLLFSSWSVGSFASGPVPQPLILNVKPSDYSSDLNAHYYPLGQIKTLGTSSHPLTFVQCSIVNPNGWKNYCQRIQFEINAATDQTTEKLTTYCRTDDPASAQRSITVLNAMISSTKPIIAHVKFRAIDYYKPGNGQRVTVICKAISDPE
jgi:hypothetical protein